MIDVALSGEALDLASISGAVNPASGAVSVFVGIVRDQTDGRKVVRLEFEAYESMAIAEMRKIADEAVHRWKVRDVVMYHRTGVVGLGEVVVVIAVGAERRGPAFAACRFAIDTLKDRVPIWKKEVFVDGSEWVRAHP